MDKRYLELKYNDVNIVVKLDDEGVIVDVWKDDQVVATTWKTYDEFSVAVEDLPADNS